jgi:GH24 family phage-related lysozyme (muramidase)
MIRDNEQELLTRQKPLNNEEVLVIFNKDLSNAIEDTKKFIDPATIESEAFEVCVHLCFWIGLPRLLGFKKCRQALRDKDYVLASEELMDSKMGKSDVRGLVNRITELSARMRDV